MTNASGKTKNASQVSYPIKTLARVFVRLFGWQVVGGDTDIKKCVLISQHTSNWDGFVTVTGAFSLGIRPRWIGKHSLFKGWKGHIMRWSGGIEVDRSISANVVEQVAQRYEQESHLWLFVAPEGTRKKVEYWKSGFYYIAMRVEVPIVHGYLDYKERKVGIGAHLYPSGDINADLEIIRTWFEHTEAKHPEKVSEIRLKPDDK